MTLRVLITGAADGIGRALADTWLSDGAHVVGIDCDPQASDRAREAGIDMRAGDLSEAEEVDRIAAALAAEAPFDVVVHNAGISCVGPFADSDPAAQRAVLRVNLEAPLVLTNAMLAAGRVTSGGHLVYVSSLSHQVGYPGAAVYAATKDGLASYARSLHVALAPQGIRVLRVFPGPTRTAHAARYAPKGSAAAKRMPPARVASEIRKAMARKARILIPGAGNRWIARLGRLSPRLMDALMRRAILRPLERDAAAPQRPA